MPPRWIASSAGCSVCFLFLFILSYTVFQVYYKKLECSVVEPTTVIPVLKPAEQKQFAWDAMDGEGHQFQNSQGPILMEPRYEKLEMLPSCDLNDVDVDVQPDVRTQIERVKKEFLTCIQPIVEQWKNRPNEMNVEWVEKVKICDDQPSFQTLGVEQFNNLHETKWTILPKCKEPNVLVTLGVGHDTIAEELLNRTLPNTVFYGADPIIEPNRRMYSAFGKFFPFAVGRKSGFSKFRVLPNQNQRTRSYVDEDVITIDFLYFLKEVLQLKKIDFAWIDIEGGEFEFLNQLHRNGPLDNAGISICQFNLEVHSKFHPPGAQIFHDFIFRVLEEGRFVFMNSLHTDVGVHRMYFVNVEDEKCLTKFFNMY